MKLTESVIDPIKKCIRAARNWDTSIRHPDTPTEIAAGGSPARKTMRAASGQARPTSAVAGSSDVGSTTPARSSALRPQRSRPGYEGTSGRGDNRRTSWGSSAPARGGDWQTPRDSRPTHGPFIRHGGNFEVLARSLQNKYEADFYTLGVPFDRHSVDRARVLPFENWPTADREAQIAHVRASRGRIQFNSRYSANVEGPMATPPDLNSGTPRQPRSQTG